MPNLNDVFFGDGAGLFTFFAGIGTLFFLVRLVMMFAGLGDADDATGAIEAGGDHADSTDAFKVLSVQSVLGFAMGFGWGGLVGLRALDWSFSMALITAVAGGALITWLLAWLLRGLQALHASGTMSRDAAMGAEGTVYATVPAAGQGRGQVRLVIDRRERYFNAVSESGEIPTHARIRVTRVNADGTVSIEAV